RNPLNNFKDELTVVSSLFLVDLGILLRPFKTIIHLILIGLELLILLLDSCDALFHLICVVAIQTCCLGESICGVSILRPFIRKEGSTYDCDERQDGGNPIEKITHGLTPLALSSIPPEENAYTRPIIYADAP